MPLTDDARLCFDTCLKRLLTWRGEQGHWRGELSSSALSTAVACFALRLADKESHRPAVVAAEGWLVEHMNADGSWGDTPVSQGNLSTTLLALSALRHSDLDAAKVALTRALAWVEERAGGTAPADLCDAVLSHYGQDRTFSVPILTMCALSGMLGESPACWKRIPRLPFELACLPRRSFALVGLPVVSYALPALIAMGLVRYVRGQGTHWPWRALAVKPALRRLTTLQPDNGGFLEATPLTGFVAMSLVAAGHADHPVVRKGLVFLKGAQRADGSWPIDTDLATWVTTLAVNALEDELPRDAVAPLRNWLLNQQFDAIHPFTGAAPGGWGWTDLPGSVPDADDTAGALVALYTLDPAGRTARQAAERGLTWLLGVRNRDGGIPTFCRGWGTLPFDRSCADITAHALRAMALWHRWLTEPLRREIDTALDHGLSFLRTVQRADGAWLPLWFGNEAVADHSNPVYGTARVLLSLGDLEPPFSERARPMIEAGVHYLCAAQHEDGGWGGDAGISPTVEETALGVAALAAHPAAARQHAERGVGWLIRHIPASVRPAPIGLYFASLWYYEDLYPWVFAADALKRWLDRPGER